MLKLASTSSSSGVLKISSYTKPIEKLPSDDFTPKSPGFLKLRGMIDETRCTNAQSLAKQVIAASKSDAISFSEWPHLISYMKKEGKLEPAQALFCREYLNLCRSDMSIYAKNKATLTFFRFWDPQGTPSAAITTNLKDVATQRYKKLFFEDPPEGFVLKK